MSDAMNQAKDKMDKAVEAMQDHLAKLRTGDRKSTRLNSSHSDRSRMPSSA